MCLNNSSSAYPLCPKICPSWISFKMLPNQCLQTHIVTTIIHYPAPDMPVQHYNINWLSSFLTPCGALSSKIDEVWHGVWAAFLTWQTTGVVITQNGGGKTREGENYSVSRMAAASCTCFARQLKHCFSDFTLHSNT